MCNCLHELADENAKLIWQEIDGKWHAEHAEMLAMPFDEWIQSQTEESTPGIDADALLASLLQL